jgi:hypothetical protein
MSDSTPEIIDQKVMAASETQKNDKTIAATAKRIAKALAKYE